MTIFTIFLALLALTLTIAVSARVTLFSSQRVRRMRWRIIFRLHPGPGFATLAELAIRWSRLAALHHGRRARPSMRLHHRITARTTEYAIRLGRAQYFRRVFARAEDQTIILSLPRSGKALAVDTAVPTPGGWTTMGEITAGDTVFGSDGSPVRVTDAWDIRYDRPCFEVEFSDGSKVIADADHQWLVHTRSSRMAETAQRIHPGSRGWPGRRKFPEVLTTAEMAGNVRIGSDDRANYSVATPLALQLPEADLPVPPYTLGAWLGDGTSKSGNITNQDPEVKAAIEAEGETCRPDRSPSALRRGACNYLVEGLHPRLRAIGVLKNKHIPALYLRASEQQRRDLLSGLLDTDGSCGKSVEFYSTSERLAADTRHLAASLGYKTTITSKPARLYDKDCGTAWTVTISAGTEMLFRIARKAARQAGTGQGRAAARSPHRYITNIRPVPSVPVRCIAVDAPDHLFLVGQTCIPTHNSGMLADRVIDHPGAALVTESRPDIYTATAGYRVQLGPVEVFNPENVSGIPSTFGWGMTIGCEDPSEAIRRAADLVGAVANVGEMAWWVEKSAAALAAGMHAAALIGGDMGDVWAWANGYGAGAVDDARKHPAASPELFGSLAELDRPGKTADSIRLTMSKALTWLAIPEIRAMVTGPAARPFDVGAFTDARGTIYMLAPGGDGAPCAPLFRCFASYVHRAARHHGLAQPHRKLDPGLLFALDELHLCPVDLPAWLADSAGKGIQVAAVVHSTGQLRDKYGEHGADTVWSTAGTKIFLPGIHDTGTLEDVSKLCGTLGDGDKAQRVMPPELLARLPDWHALVISVNKSPVVIRFRPSWRRIEARLGQAPKPLPSYRYAVAPAEPVITELDSRRTSWPAADHREDHGESA